MNPIHILKPYIFEVYFKYWRVDTILWDMKLGALAEGYSSRSNIKPSKLEASLFLEHEDGSSMFLRILGKFLSGHMAWYSRRQEACSS
jgi:hypothetical protein